jgi:hypothetical protein
MDLGNKTEHDHLQLINDKEIKAIIKDGKIVSLSRKSSIQ